MLKKHGVLARGYQAAGDNAAQSFDSSSGSGRVAAQVDLLGVRADWLSHTGKNCSAHCVAAYYRCAVRCCQSATDADRAEAAAADRTSRYVSALRRIVRTDGVTTLRKTTS